MPFNLLKRMWSKPLHNPDQTVSKSRMSIRVSVESGPETAHASSVGIFGNPDAIMNPDSFGNPSGRCGFITGTPEPHSPSDGESAVRQSSAILQEEPLLEKIMNVDNLEVYLKVIGDLVSEYRELEHREDPEPGIDELAEDFGDDFTLWGKRVPGSSANRQTH